MGISGAAALAYLQAGAAVVSAGAAIHAATKKPKMPAAPKAMPTPDDEAVKVARRRQVSEMTQRSGRASTILTHKTTDSLGG